MRTLSLLALTALALPADALACGGFFCNNDFPIDQAGEQIVFGVDTGSGTTTVHVQVEYAGASDDFAWVVPVAAQPELAVSSDALFTALANATEPQFFLQYEQTGLCDWGWGFESDDMDMGAEDPSPTADGGNGVTVVAEQQVGPYDTVTLQANSSGELLTWLNEAGYDLPADLDPVLAPYVANGQYFVALKLSAGNDTGDLQPLAMTYDGVVPAIPIQLTSVAATPDMRLEVFVLGDERAVPDNYLHVTINESAIDWFNGGNNYEDVITLAADEAGGQAFATDFSGSTERLRGSLWTDGRYDIDGLRSAQGPSQWLDGLISMGFPPSAALLELFMDVIPFPAELESQGVSPQNFYDCLECYAEYIDEGGFDADDATDALESRVIDGLREAEAMFARHDHMTRMTSSMDAIEMTIDPLFVFNRDMPQEVSNVHTATVTMHCGAGESWDNAERTLELADGRQIRLPSQRWTRDAETTEYELMGDLTSPAAILIEDVGPTGNGEIVFDYREESAARARAFDRPGCGCSATSTPALGGLWLLGLGLIGLRRRRA